MADIKGTFLWYELMTSDVDAAKAFYGEIVGWGTQAWDEAPSDMPYQMWTHGGKPLGGVMLLPEEAKALGAPPHWMAYVGTPDLVATKAKLVGLGGTVLNEMTIPKVGGFVVFRDPTGAVLTAFQPEGDEPPGETGPGTFCWNELWTSDPDKAWEFHSQLWGWEKGDSMEPTPGQTYQMFKQGEKVLGGYGKKQEDMPGPSAWLYYITVADLDAALGQVKARGGQVVRGPMGISGGQRVAQCLDPQGVAFALHVGA